MATSFLKLKPKKEGNVVTEQTADDIEMLEGIEAIRIRVSYYLGSSNSHAIFQLIKEAADNSFDEAKQNRNSFVGVWVGDNNQITVWDKGGGIPVDIHKKTKEPAIIGIFQKLHAGGKFGSNAYSSVKGTAGVHGVGITATNALSASLEVWTFKNSKWHYIAFKKGDVVTPLNTKTKIPNLPVKVDHGTIIRFTPDFTRFDTGSKLSVKTLKDYLMLQAFLHPSVKVYLKTLKNEYHFHEKEGLKALLNKQVTELGEETLGKPFVFSDGAVDIALVWSKNSGEHVNSYVSGSATKSGGTHVVGLNNAIRDALKPYKGKFDFVPAEARDGLVGTINVSVVQPKFTSQSKEELASEAVTESVYTLLKPAFDEYFKSNKGLTKVIVQRAADLHKSYAKFTADRKSIAALKSKTAKALLSSKLAKAKTKDFKRIELFIVEGSGAGGTAKQARDKEYQAVLSLKGKILNAFRATPDKLFNNEEIQNICMGIGFELDAKNSIEKLRVGKIILLADPDVDGCLDPNTRILTLDGKNPSIKELQQDYTKGKPSRQIYSQDIAGNLVIGEAYKPRIAVNTKKACKLVFKDGTEVKCTRDHEWAINGSHPKAINRNGTLYVRAEDLRPKDSITSLYLEKLNIVVREKANNHTISKVVLIKHKEEKPYYCLTVPEYGNFFVDDGQGNGVLSKNSHITNLMLSFFQKVFPETFEKGHVYTCDTPLFYCQRPNGEKIFGDSLNNVKATMEAKGFRLPPEGIQRIKGYGEIEVDTMQMVAFDAKTRILTRMLPTKGKDTIHFAKLVSQDTSARQELLGV